LFRCYFQVPTQIHSEILFSYSLVYSFIVIIIKYRYNWYQILDLGFKPVNGYHTQLRSNRETCRRVKQTNDGLWSDVRDDIEEAQWYDDAFTTAWSHYRAASGGGGHCLSNRGSRWRRTESQKHVLQGWRGMQIRGPNIW